MSGLKLEMSEYVIEIYDKSNFDYERIINDPFIVFKYFNDINRTLIYKLKKDIDRIQVFKVENDNIDCLKKFDFYLIEGRHLVELKSYKFYENFQNHMSRYWYIHYEEEDEF